jgi:hypothetical protein
MKTEIKKAKVKDSMEPTVILGILIAGGLILWKSGAFGLLNKATKTAGTILDDTMALPDNLVTLAGLAPQIPLAIAQNTSAPMTQQSIFDNAIQGKVQTFPGVASITQRTANMIQSVYGRYTGVTASNWSQVAVSHHAKFDANGYIISDDLSSTSGTNKDMSYIAAHGGTI